VLLSTEWAGHYNGVEWKFLHPCGDIAATVLARYNELLSILHCSPQYNESVLKKGAGPTSGIANDEGRLTLVGRRKRLTRGPDFSRWNFKYEWIEGRFFSHQFFKVIADYKSDIGPRANHRT